MEGKARTRSGRRRAFTASLQIAWLHVAGICIATVMPSLALANIGGGPTGCYHLCPDDWIDHVNGTGNGTCVVQGAVTAISGSEIDCDTLDVVISTGNGGGSLKVQNGRFRLHASDLTIIGNGAFVKAICTQAASIGFTLDLDGDLLVTQQGDLDASCNYGGGAIEIDAGGSVTLNGRSLKAKGTATGAAGGAITIRAADDVVADANVSIEAQANQSSGTVADGGTVEITGEDVTIAETIDVQGKNASGGSVAVSARGNLTLGGIVNAEGAGGDGGEISLEAGGLANVDKALRALGEMTQGDGGTVEVEAEAMDLDGSINASGGATGGGIRLSTRGGSLQLAGAGTGIVVEAKRASNNPGDGGTIDLEALGGDVLVRNSTVIDASGSGSGLGGTVVVAGVGVTLEGGTAVRADASAGGSGGHVTIRWRDKLTGSTGGVSATNGGRVTLAHRLSAPSHCAAGSSCGCPGGSTCENLTLSHLRPACGDDVRRAGSTEQCDGTDLDEADCGTVPGGFSGGVLRCGGTCAFDTSGCTP